MSLNLRVQQLHQQAVNLLDTFNVDLVRHPGTLAAVETLQTAIEREFDLGQCQWYKTCIPAETHQNVWAEVRKGCD